MSASRMGPRGNRRGADARFKTDSDISATSAPIERPLQQWVDDDADSVPANELASMSLDSSAKDAKGWDQFAANKEKFGIVPTYDERLYTTEINRTHPDYAKREQRAQQIAKEIEGQAYNGNVHQAEERGIKFDDSGLDEEDRYSGVARTKPKSFEAFAAGEAQRAINSPGYLDKREEALRNEDSQKLSQIFRGKAESTPLPGSIQKKNQQGKKGHERSASTVSSKTSAEPTSTTTAAAAATGDDKPAETKPKKKFNFAASAARASSFKSSMSPSPRQSSFSPVTTASPHAMLPPSVVPAGGPPMMPVPGASPFQFIPHPSPGMPGMGPVPPGPAAFSPGPSPVIQLPGSTPHASSGPESRDDSSRASSTVDLSKIKPLDNAFDYISNLNKKGEEIPKMYFTAPTWSTSSQVSYVDQFPVATVMPRMPTMMPPMGFMYPPPF